MINQLSNNYILCIGCNLQTHWFLISFSIWNRRKKFTYQFTYQHRFPLICCNLQFEQFQLSKETINLKTSTRIDFYQFFTNIKGNKKNLQGVAVNQWFSRIWLDFILLDKIYIKQYNWITIQYMYFILKSPPLKQIYTYIYYFNAIYIFILPLKSTKDLVSKIETIS